ncbi:hypothetical protein M9H77_34814 [Catharanthus roseus]|uniref:Uncharacterized protein n=1 Tax=Catharanthus roseus TaxID=4058 RepID=A0ACB9ZNY3_CATRO|nr:hypothetical protein M9H77_34814 [Catharanthus roseus]
MRDRLLWNRALVWCLAGIDYEMLELGSDDLVLGFGLCPWSPDTLHVLLKLGLEAALMCLDSLRLPNCARNPRVGSSISGIKYRKVYRYPTQPQFTYRIATSSSYSLREIVLEREPILVIDFSDSESIEGPVATGIGLGASIEEDPSELKSDSKMMPKPERMAPADTGGMGTFVAGTLPIATSPTPIPLVKSVSSFPASLSLLQDGVREHDICGYCFWREQQAAMLEMELVQMQEVHAAREREILELIHERDWLRQFLAQLLSTTRDSVDRACAELESRPGCSGSQRHQADIYQLRGLLVLDLSGSLETCQVHDLIIRTRLYLKVFKTDSLNPVELQRALAPFPPMRFAAAVEAATRTEIVDQVVIQRKTVTGSAATPYKCPGQGP